MSKRITWEARARILSRMKDDFWPLARAASEYGVAEATIRRWLRESEPKAKSLADHISRLRRENRRLRIIAARLVVECQAYGLGDDIWEKLKKLKRYDT